MRNGGRFRGLRVTADKGVGANGERAVGMSVPQQFPGERGGVLRLGDDFHADMLKAVADVIPYYESVEILRVKNMGEKRLADVPQPRFDLRRDFRRGIMRVFGVLFEIPANLFLFLRGQRELEFDVGGSARSVALKGAFDAVTPLAESLLRQSENDRHTLFSLSDGVVRFIEVLRNNETAEITPRSRSGCQEKTIFTRQHPAIRPAEVDGVNISGG